MAKNSARSKGYRKYKKEVKGFTPQEKKTMIIGFSVLIVILICVLVIPNAIEARHLLKVKDGVVQDVGENWLISDMSETSKPKYRKIAEVSPAEGYELSKVEDGISDAQERYYSYAPVDAENAVAQSYYAIVGKGAYDQLATTAAGYMSNFAAEILYMGEPVTEEAENGLKTSYYIMEYTINTSQDEENPVYEYNQSVSLYVDSNVDGRCVLFNASNTGADDTVFGDRDAIVAMLKDAASKTVLAAG